MPHGKAIMSTRNFSLEQYEVLLAQAEAEVNSMTSDLAEAIELSRKAGLSTEGELSKATTAASTGGHSNTDHLIVQTGNYTLDRVSELRRRYLMRQRAEQPECRKEDRWDKPRVFGERRRRINRDKDSPTAPPEPPMSGYIVFLGQMTTKIRHDRINEPHSQAKAVSEISRLWRMALSEEEREYYHNFAEECRKEYRKLHMEFRATGYYKPSEIFERTEGTGLWFHKRPEDRNDLEKEIASYDTVLFPSRPPELNEEYQRREKQSQERRKRKLRAEREEKRRRMEATVPSTAH